MPIGHRQDGADLSFEPLSQVSLIVGLLVELRAVPTPASAAKLAAIRGMPSPSRWRRHDPVVQIGQLLFQLHVVQLQSACDCPGLFAAG